MVPDSHELPVIANMFEIGYSTRENQYAISEHRQTSPFHWELVSRRQMTAEDLLRQIDIEPLRGCRVIRVALARRCWIDLTLDASGNVTSKSQPRCAES